MKLQFIRPHRQWTVGDVGEVSHEGVANELIRRGVAHKFIEVTPESQLESSAAQCNAAQDDQSDYGKKRKRGR